MTVTQIAYYRVLGLPLIAVLGIFTYLSFLLTASVPILNRKGIRYIPFKYHKYLAGISITLATIHGLLGLLLYLS